MKTSSKLLALAAIGAGAAAVSYAVSERLTLRSYPIYSEKISSPVKILQISDLHSSRYGNNGSELIENAQRISPDIVALTGDIIDDRAPNTSTLKFLKELASIFPCYYVSGNHECYTHFLPAIKEKLEDYGITVLDGKNKTVWVNNESISLCGIDDPLAFPDKEGRLWEECLCDLSRSLDSKTFNVLLSHRPEPVSIYQETGFDLVLSGHAHGGQVIVPFLINGLYAPHQGLFPEYAGGIYPIANGGNMIVSRGLSKRIRPRVFNRPELIVITLLPKEQTVD